MGLFTKRATVLGLPIGPSRVDWGRVAMSGGAVALVAAGQQGRKQVRQASQQLKEPLEQGKQAISEASEIGEDVAQVTDRFASGGGGGGGGGLLGKAGSLLGRGGGGGDGGEGGGYTKKLRLVIKEHQDVGVPRSVAYNQWTQYPDFPQFMKGVVAVEPEDEVTQKWTAKVGPSRRTFTGHVSEQVPDERIQWEGSEGVEQFGTVTFHELDDNLTRVQVEMEYHPSGFVEKVGNVFLAARMRVRKDLRLFKHYLELENAETGAWRGEIADGEVVEGGEEAEGEEEAGEQEPQEGEEQAPARAGEDAAERGGDGQEGRARQRAGKEAAEGDGGQRRADDDEAEQEAAEAGQQPG